MKLRKWILWMLVLLLFLMALGRLEQGNADKGRQQLEQALRRTAVACFAAEGAYPPSLDYMQAHYGLQYDKDAYVVRYEVFASNLMPQITVLEAAP